MDIKNNWTEFKESIKNKNNVISNEKNKFTYLSDYTLCLMTLIPIEQNTIYFVEIL